MGIITLKNVVEVLEYFLKLIANGAINEEQVMEGDRLYDKIVKALAAKDESYHEFEGEPLKAYNDFVRFIKTLGRGSQKQ